MKTVLITPNKYVQGRGVLNELGDYVKMLGEKPIILWSPGIRGVIGETVRASLERADLPLDRKSVV